MDLPRLFISMLLFPLIGGGCRPKTETIDALVVDLGRPETVEDARGRLARIGLPVIPHLIKALNDPNPMTRTNAVWTLGSIPESRKTSAPHLIAALDDPDGLFRSALIWELGRIGRPVDKLFPLFVRHLDDEHVRTRVNAADALVRLEQNQDLRLRDIPLDKILQVLSAAMAEEDVWPPCHAAPVLTALGPRARPAIPALLHALHHTHFLARIEAGRTLHLIEPQRDPEIVEAVTPALNADGPWTEPAAVKLLTEIGTFEARKALERHGAQ